MTATLDLLARCESRGVRLAADGRGGLTIDAPGAALTPDLMEALRRHKAELLTKLQGGDQDCRRPGSFRPFVVYRDGTSRVLSADEADNLNELFEPVEPFESQNVLEPVGPICRRCGGGVFVESAIHGGRSTRRDCRRCGRFATFPKWYGQVAGT